MKDFILKGKMTKVMWKLSIPGIIGMVLFGINQLIDAIFVGNFVGSNALAGVSLSLPIAQLFIGFGAMVGGGAAAVLSISIGAKDKDTQSKILRNMNLLTLIITVITMTAGIIFCDKIIRLMGGSGELLTYGKNYLMAIFLGAVFPIWGLGGNFVIRAEGKMKEAMIFAGIGVIGNIILNYIFMGVFKWGVVGAAWATNAGMFLYCVANTIYFISKKPSFEAKVFGFRFDKEIFFKIVSLGMPAMIMQVMMLIQQLTAYRIIANHGGNSDIAFFGAALRLFFVASLPAAGMMRSLQPVVGINYGAKNNGRVRLSVRTFSIAMVSMLTIVWLAMFIFPNAMLSSMLPDQIFSAQEIFNFRLFISILPIVPIAFVALTYLPSVGKGGMASVLAMCRQIFLFIPAALIASSFFGLNGVYYALFGTDVVIVIISLLILIFDLKRLDKELTPQLSASDV